MAVFDPTQPSVLERYFGPDSSHKAQLGLIRLNLLKQLLYRLLNKQAKAYCKNWAKVSLLAQ
jgi:hypothetical protein